MISGLPCLHIIVQFRSFTKMWGTELKPMTKMEEKEKKGHSFSRLFCTGFSEEKLLSNQLISYFANATVNQIC